MSASLHGGTATSAEMKLFKDDGEFRDVLRDEPAYIVKDGSGTGNRDGVEIGTYRGCVFCSVITR